VAKVEDAVFFTRMSMPGGARREEAQGTRLEFTYLSERFFCCSVSGSEIVIGIEFKDAGILFPDFCVSGSVSVVCGSVKQGLHMISLSDCGGIRRGGGSQGMACGIGWSLSEIHAMFDLDVG